MADEWDQFNDAPDAGTELYKAYPGLKNYNVQVKDSTSTGKDWRGQPYAGRKMEFYAPDEGYNPNPGKPTIEMFTHDMSPKDAMGEMFSHYLPKVDQEFGSAREKFVKSIDGKQKQMLYGDYQQQIKSGVFNDQKPSFDQWLNTNGGDAFFRGYVSDQYPKELYRQDQIKMFEPLMAKLQSDPWSQFQDAQPQASATPADVSRGTSQPADNKQGFFEYYNSRPGNPLLNAAQDFITEPVAQMASGTAGTIAGGWRAILSGLDGSKVAPTADAMTYQPKTPAGKIGSAAVAYPFQKLAQGADWTGGKVAEGMTAAGASPEIAGGAGAFVNTGIQMAAPLLLGKALRAPLSKEQAGDAATRDFKANEQAKAYVNNRTGVTWDSLAEGTRDTLRQIGYDAANFDKLEPAAAKRQLQLASLKKPITTATRGQVTRDPIQLQREELLKSTDAGAPLRDMALEQNRTIIDNLDLLKGKKQQASLSTGGKATSQEQTGASVQGAARAKEALSKKNYSDLYKKAEATEPDATVSAQPLYDLLTDNPEIQHLGFVQTWLNKASLSEATKGTKGSIDSLMNRTEPTASKTVMREVNLRELEDLRKKASGISAQGGDNAYYAAEVVRSIDNAFENIPQGANAWKAARDAFKQHKLQFADQSSIESLVSNASRTDRATALEDTWRKTVVSGSLDDLKKVQRTLLTGGDGATRTMGRKAWRDLQAQTVDYIRQESTKGITNQAGESNLTYAGMKQAINRVGPEKLKVVLGEKDAATVQNILKAAETLKTEPAGTGVHGSNTVNKILNIMDKSLLTKIPGVGQTAEGIVRAAGKVAELGKGGRDARQATTSQFNDLARQSTESVNRLNKKAATKNALYQYGPATVPASGQQRH